MKKLFVFKFLLPLAFITSIHLKAQKGPPQLTSAEKKTTIDSLSNKLNRGYVFPEMAMKMCDMLAVNLKKGAYNDLQDPRSFAQRLTEDLQSVSGDAHLNIGYDPERIKKLKEIKTSKDSIEMAANEKKESARNNYGFKEVKILEGNIGYLNLEGFEIPEYAGETAAASMNFLSNTDAIIIDLRNNRGGSPEMVQLLVSYFFNSTPIHINSFYYRNSNYITQSWTLPYVQGKRMPDKPVFVVTSSRTFSAAEEFCYDLKNLNRAITIGETTGGGANPGDYIPVTDQFAMFLPNGRAINPITNTNWEGIGIKPDIESSASMALNRAHIAALEKLTEKQTGNPDYAWLLSFLKAKEKPAAISEEVLKQCAGNFGERKITFEQGRLYYERKGRSKKELFPISENIFIIDEVHDVRIQIIKENNSVKAINMLYFDGFSQKFDVVKL